MGGIGRRAGLGVALVLLCMCTGCGLLDPSGADLNGTARDFSTLMRWGERESAAAFFVPSLQGDFLRRFAGLKELNVTSMELAVVPRQSGSDPATMRTRGQMEYYLLPSLTLKTLPLDLEWTLLGEPGMLPRSWRISSPFPSLEGSK